MNEEHAPAVMETWEEMVRGRFEALEAELQVTLSVDFEGDIWAEDTEGQAVCIG